MTEPQVKIRVSPIHNDRVSAWGVSCNGCNPSPELVAPSKRAAENLASIHARSEHGKEKLLIYVAR